MQKGIGTGKLILKDVTIFSFSYATDLERMMNEDGWYDQLLLTHDPSLDQKEEEKE